MVSWASLDPVAGVAGSVFGGVVAVLLVVFAIAVAGWPDIGCGEDDDD